MRLYITDKLCVFFSAVFSGAQVIIFLDLLFYIDYYFLFKMVLIRLNITIFIKNILVILFVDSTNLVQTYFLLILHKLEH